jgi:transcription antitermination factor NusG
MPTSQELPGAQQAADSPGLWYAVYTKSNYEKKVASLLSHRGITNYLPVWKEMHSWTDRRKVVDVPVFRGYVFARFEDSGRNRLTILQTPGVARIVSTCGGIEPIPEGEIVAVQQLLTSGVKCAPHPFLQEGDWVRVTKGPLQGVEGLFLRQKGPTRLLISVSLISQSVAVEIEAVDIEIVTPGDSHAESQNLWADQTGRLRPSAA